MNKKETIHTECSSENKPTKLFEHLLYTNPTQCGDFILQMSLKIEKLNDLLKVTRSTRITMEIKTFLVLQFSCTAPLSRCLSYLL